MCYSFIMVDQTPPEFIESTAGQVAAELACRGVARRYTPAEVECMQIEARRQGEELCSSSVVRPPIKGRVLEDYWKKTMN